MIRISLTHKHLLMLFVLGTALQPIADVSAQNVIYVDLAASGAESGSSWIDAFSSLQDALSVSADGDEIWIAEGRYTPDKGIGITEGDRSATFEITNLVDLYGGFGGEETNRDQRDPSNHESILSGDLEANDLESDFPVGSSRSENSITILRLVENLSLSADNVTIVDGVTLEGKQSTGSPSNRGGSLIISGRAARLIDLIVRDNVSESGAGISICNVSENVSLESVRLINNYAEREGGAIRSNCFGSIRISNSLFDSNMSVENGGAIFAANLDLKIVRTTFSNNMTSGFGGAALLDESFLTIWNSRFYSNSAEAGGGALDVAGDDSPNHTAIIGSLFHNNRAGSEGGAIYTGGQSLRIINSTFSGNSAAIESSVLHQFYLEPEQSLTIQNSIFWSNTTDQTQDDDAQIWRPVSATTGLFSISNSIYQGDLHPSFSVINDVSGADPWFVKPLGLDGEAGTEDDDFRLSAFSIGIDRGNNEWLPSDSLDLDLDEIFWEKTPVDLDERHRAFSTGVWAGTVDIGPYEYGSPVISVSIETEALLIPQPLLFELYPSPASNIVNIRFLEAIEQGPRDSSLVLFDALGREVTRWPLADIGNSSIPQLDISNLSPGMYWLRFSGADNSISKPLIIIR